jgi:citrate lyase subunit beta/citryl-CoA lyase
LNLQAETGSSFRPQRSVLSVPAINPALFPKALSSDADYVMLDCEDSVSAAEKPRARRNTIAAAREFDWQGHGKTLMVRINGPDTHFMYRDLVDIMEAAGGHIHSVMLPKAGRAADIQMLDCLLSQIESACGIGHCIRIHALIESARGGLAVADIAAASSRLEALHFGAGDFAASCGARTVQIGGLNPEFPGDPWHPVLQLMVMACRANGLQPIDSAYGDFSDTHGYLAAARRAAALGFSGKWAIHPSQIALANQVMTPTPEEVAEARAVLEAMAEARRDGRGAVSLDGKMLDVASIRMAQNVVALDDALRSRSSTD